MAREAGRSGRERKKTITLRAHTVRSTYHRAGPPETSGGRDGEEAAEEAAAVRPLGHITSTRKALRASVG